jgi:hypothetical protein
MIIEHVRMWWRVVVVGIGMVLAAGCTKPNPLSCADGLCSDPAFPFCDEDGSFGENVQTCIAVDCTPMAFETCRGDQAITCNAAGNDFDLVGCERGCDAASGGCRLCDPNETACTNGKTATCDAAGAVVSTETCALGCFEDQPRCRDIDPSNGLAQFLDMVPNPPDLDLINGDLNTTNGDVRSGGMPVTVPNFLVPAPAGGAPIRVFVANHVHLTDVGVVGQSALSPAIAIVAASDIVIAGRLTLRGEVGEVSFASCMPGFGVFDDTVTASNGTRQTLIAGSGGGGHATAGGAGGSVDSGGGPGAVGGKAGGASGNESLIPLRGGCPGGGAIQLASRTSITVDGIIDARGAPGEQPQGIGDVYGGGGGGGGVLLEAPTVTLAPAARLIATGGPGSTNTTKPLVPNDDATPALGMVCSPAIASCGNGGNGAAPNVPATAGGTAAYTNSATVTFFSAGGGGGGLGRVRINTQDGTYVKGNTTVESAALTTGVLQTR